MLMAAVPIIMYAHQGMATLHRRIRDLESSRASISSLGAFSRVYFVRHSCHDHHAFPSLNLLAIGVGYVAAKIASEARADIKHVLFLGIDMSIHTKSLIVNIIVLVIVLIIGIVFYSVRTRLSFIDAMYMTVQTVTTGMKHAWLPSGPQ